MTAFLEGMATGLGTGVVVFFITLTVFSVIDEQPFRVTLTQHRDDFAAFRRKLRPWFGLRRKRGSHARAEAAL